MEENEKLGRIVFDGKIYDLDSMNSSELKKLQNKMKEHEDNLNKRFDDIVEEGEK